MKKPKPTALDFVIDKLTNSIENILTGDSFPTEISLVSGADLRSVTKKGGWLFDWSQHVSSSYAL